MDFRYRIWLISWCFGEISLFLSAVAIIVITKFQTVPFKKGSKHVDLEFKGILLWRTQGMAYCILEKKNKSSASK